MAGVDVDRRAGPGRLDVNGQAFDVKRLIVKGVVPNDRERGERGEGVRPSDKSDPSKGKRASRSVAVRGVIERDIVQTYPDKDTELILYCGGGYRSALATDMLQKMGYTNVWSMAGGWKAWKDSGAPTSRDWKR